MSMPIQHRCVASNPTRSHDCWCERGHNHMESAHLKDMAVARDSASTSSPEGAK
jgi:hypothetical protein